MGLLRTKSVERSLAEADEPEYQLKKTLNAFDLVVFGVGIIIGAGIFTLTGRVAHELAGPSVILSFIIAAACCALAAMCYAEFSSAVPVSGSAYTFSYVALGEIFAWIIGWDLLLELLLAASVVAQGWSAYFTSLVGNWFTLPPQLTHGGVVDLPAIILILGLGALMIYGIRESMRVNTILVALKLFIVLFVIFAGLQFIDPANWDPFIPPAQAQELSTASIMTQPLLQFLSGKEPMAFGVGGIFAAASLVFFAYLGFDVIATTAEETKNPKRDLPIGILVSLLICTVLYCAVALVVTGMVPYDQLSPSASLAEAFAFHGKGWMSVLISAGAVAGLTTVVLTLLIGSSRLVFAMSRDGLLPIGLAKIHPKWKTPWVIGIIISVLCAFVAGFTPVGILEEMVNIGTLSAFLIVSISVLVLRKKRPDLPRPFRVPGVPVVPILSALICLYLMLNLSVETWLRFVVWMVVGLVIYFLYSYQHARLGLDITLHEFAEQQHHAAKGHTDTAEESVSSHLHVSQEKKHQGHADKDASLRKKE